MGTFLEKKKRKMGGRKGKKEKKDLKGNEPERGVEEKKNLI